MKNYLVISPLMSVTIPIMDGGSGPEEEYRCVAEVVAQTKREAIKTAAKTLDMKAWVEQQRSNGLSPFVGLKAEIVETEAYRQSMAGLTAGRVEAAA